MFLTSRWSKRDHKRSKE